MTAMADWTVRLPSAVREPYEVYINGVRQQPDVDYRVRGRVLIISEAIAEHGHYFDAGAPG